MMKIVIIDDSKKKQEVISNLLCKKYSDIELFSFSSYEKGMSFIQRYYPEVNYLILDWNFPYYDGGVVHEKMGERILKECINYDISIPTIICSTGPILVAGKYQNNIIGQVSFDDLESIDSLALKVQNHEKNVLIKKRKEVI